MSRMIDLLTEERLVSIVLNSEQFLFTILCTRSRVNKFWATILSFSFWFPTNFDRRRERLRLNVKLWNQKEERLTKYLVVDHLAEDAQHWQSSFTLLSNDIFQWTVVHRITFKGTTTHYIMIWQHKNRFGFNTLKRKIEGI